MPNVICVPQGRSARFSSSTCGYNISGLYTDGFSSCNIVVCINKNRITLSHFDAQTNFNRIRSEISWVNEGSDSPCTLLIISRCEKGTLLKKHLLERFESFASVDLRFTIIEKEIDNLHNGIYVSLEEQEVFEIHPRVKTFPIGDEPENLIHHPQEQEFLAVQKIEQIIGIKFKYMTKQFRDKVLSIFDGETWIKLDESELKIDNSDSETKKELSFVSEGKSFMEVISRLAHVAENIPKYVVALETPYEMGVSIGLYMEGYLNRFDYQILLKRNLQDLMTEDYRKNMKKSKKDNLFRENILRLSKKEGDIFSELSILLGTYKNEDKSSETQFKKDIISECEAFMAHYQARKCYTDFNEKSRKYKRQGLGIQQKAIAAAKADDIDSAGDLFLQAINIFRICCLPDDATFIYARSEYNALEEKRRIIQYARRLGTIESELEQNEQAIPPVHASTDSPLQHVNKLLNEVKSKETDETLSFQFDLHTGGKRSGTGNFSTSIKNERMFQSLTVNCVSKEVESSLNLASQGEIKENIEKLEIPLHIEESVSILSSKTEIPVQDISANLEKNEVPESSATPSAVVHVVQNSSKEKASTPTQFHQSTQAESKLKVGKKRRQKKAA